MILQALERYYELMLEDGKLPEKGFGFSNVSWGLKLSLQGELLRILPLKEQVLRGKKEVDVPRKLIVPEQKVRTGNPVPYLLCDTSAYLLGIDAKMNAKRIMLYHNAAKDLHLSVLDGVDSDMARAICAFFQSWQPERAAEHPALRDMLDQVQTGNLLFMLEGNIFAQEDKAIHTAWLNYCSNVEKPAPRRCLVTGTVEPPAVLHAKIKGIQGGQTIGTSLISFKWDAFSSYGHDGEQGLNAPIGEHAAFAYATALNYLLSRSQLDATDEENPEPPHRIVLGDTTVVFWAESTNKAYTLAFDTVINPQSGDDRALLADIMQKLANGKPVAEDVELSTPFYILGLVPNAGRLSIRFFLQSSFGDLLKNIRRHYDRLEIAKPKWEFEYLTLYWMLRETVNLNMKNAHADGQLTAAVLRSILLNRPYPIQLQQAVMLRIRVEQDDKPAQAEGKAAKSSETKHISHKITSGRAAIFKACLLSRSETQKTYKEALQVSLSETCTDVPYVLGRLFAVYEKTQRDANPEINTTIKDQFFNAACATPSNTFSTLAKLCEKHLTKLRRQKDKKGWVIKDTQLIGKLVDMLNVDDNPFPAHLKPDEQAIFVLGYYQQTQSFFNHTKKDENTSNTGADAR